MQERTFFSSYVRSYSCVPCSTRASVQCIKHGLADSEGPAFELEAKGIIARFFIAGVLLPCYSSAP
jgi:hypothetical protein